MGEVKTFRQIATDAGVPKVWKVIRDFKKQGISEKQLDQAVKAYGAVDNKASAAALKGNEEAQKLAQELKNLAGKTSEKPYARLSLGNRVVALSQVVMVEKTASTDRMEKSNQTVIDVLKRAALNLDFDHCKLIKRAEFLGERDEIICKTNAGLVAVFVELIKLNAWPTIKWLITEGMYCDGIQCRWKREHVNAYHFAAALKEMNVTPPKEYNFSSVK